MPLTPMLARLSSVQRTSTALLAIGLAALLTQPAQAQTPAAAPAAPAAPALPSSPAKQALVKRILDLQRSGIESVGNNLAAAPLLQMRRQISQVLQQRVPADRREAVAREIEGDMRKYMEEVAPLLRDSAFKAAPTTIGTMLDERFTESELKDIVALLESPVNRKYLSMAQDFQRGLGERLIADTRASVEPKLRALDQTLAKRLGLDKPAAETTPPPAPSAPTVPRN